MTKKNGDLYIEKKQSLVDFEQHSPTPSSGLMNDMCDRIPARLVLYFLSWSGFLVSFMMRNDINFAITVMIKSEHNVSAASNGSSLLNGNSTSNHTTIPDVIN